MFTPHTVNRSQQLLTLLTACLAALILPASLTGTSVAIPQINAELHPGLVELQRVVNACNLTFAAFMLSLDRWQTFLAVSVCSFLVQHCSLPAL